jgi:putative nucleotidyltransferase with HDIG domain
MVEVRSRRAIRRRCGLDGGFPPASPERGTTRMLRAIRHPRSTASSSPMQRGEEKAKSGLPADGSSVTALLARASAADAGFSVHAANVAALSMRIAQEIGVRRDGIELLGFAAAVHDVGKVEVPATIIAKAGPLEDDEWESMRGHPAGGANLLAACDVPPLVAAIVRSHHERWDGAGYPDGLSGKDIPLGARIVAVADAYCAMLEERPYRPPLTPEEAQAELRTQAGRQFDPLCAEATCRVIGAVE